MPAVSVAIPAYNAAEFLEETVASVRSQTTSDWELIIVDDGSTDRTPEIADRAAASDSRIRSINQENRGVGAARNAAIEVASADWIALLDADDQFLPQKLERQLTAAATGDCDMIYGAVEVFGETGLRSYDKWRTDEAEFRLNASEGAWRMIGHNFVPLSSTVVRRELLNEVGGFSEDPALHMVEDLQMWLRLLGRGARLRFLPHADTRYRIHGENGSGQDRMQMKRLRIAALSDAPLPFWKCELRRRAKILELQCGLARHWLKQRLRMSA